MMLNLRIEDLEASLIAIVIAFMLFKFLISHRVPGGSPGRLTDTFTSHLKDP